MERVDSQSLMSPGVLRWKDMANPAGSLTITRLGIAIGFPFLVHNTSWAISAYLFTILTDVLDGFVARKFGHSTHTGAVLDGWVDKILHINAAWSMAIHGYMPGWWMWMWFAREVVQWAMFMTIVGDFVDGKVRIQSTSLAGRATAIFLFAAFVTTLCGLPQLAWPLTIVTGGLGSLAAIGYMIRHLEDRKRFR